MSEAPTPGPGRPSLYSDELAEAICDRLINGESMRQICAGDDMPNRSTVLRWMAGRPEFATRCAHARVLQADLMDDMILETAVATTPESAPADRVKISAFQWRAAKLDPKKYGDAMQMKHSGAIGRFDASRYTDEQLEQLEGVLGDLAVSGGDAGGGEGGEGETPD